MITDQGHQHILTNTQTVRSLTHTHTHTQTCGTGRLRGWMKPNMILETSLSSGTLTPWPNETNTDSTATWM